LRQTAGRKLGGFIFVAFVSCLRLIVGSAPTRRICAALQDAMTG